MQIWVREGKVFVAKEELGTLPDGEPLETFLSRKIKESTIKEQYWMVFSPEEAEAVEAIAKMFIVKRSPYPLSYEFLSVVLQDRLPGGTRVIYIPADGHYEPDAEWRLSIAVNC